MGVINFDPTALSSGMPPGPEAVILIVAFGLTCAFAFVIWID